MTKNASKPVPPVVTTPPRVIIGDSKPIKVK